MMLAARAGFTDVVSLLLAAGGDVDAMDVTGATSLVSACKNGHAEVVELLLAARADPNAATPRERTPLMGAAENGSLDVVRVLLAAGAKVDAADKSGCTSLLFAAAGGDDALVSALLEARANPNEAAHNGRTCLMVAAQAGQESVARLLLASHADAGAVEYRGRNALFHAAEGGHMGVLQALLSSGATYDINESDSNGWTCLAVAAMENNVVVVEGLLALGADPDVTNNDGHSCLAATAELGFGSAVSALLGAGAVHGGWLEKRSSAKLTRNRWQRRWLQIGQSLALRFCKKEPERGNVGKAKCIVDMAGVSAVLGTLANRADESGDGGEGYHFGVETAARVFELRAATDEERTCWVTVLEAALVCVNGRDSGPSGV